jgi:hypothetical protein
LFPLFFPLLLLLLLLLLLRCLLFACSAGVIVVVQQTGERMCRLLQVVMLQARGPKEMTGAAAVPPSGFSRAF